MPAKTNLDYVQDILSALDSDEVNSVSDTVESMQVLRIVKRTYDSIVTRADLNEHYTLFELTASTDITKPTLMTRPTNVSSIIWVKYNMETADDSNDNFREVIFLPLDSFLNRMHNLKEDADNVESFTQVISSGLSSDTITVLYETDRAPQYYTAFDDYTLLFDSYDSDVDTTLQKTKTLCYGKKDQTFLLTDDFIPFIDVEFGSLLLNEALVVAFAELKQVPNEVANKWAMRAWTKIGHGKRAIDQGRHPLADQVNYGRK